jgi:hypothetical protein
MESLTLAQLKELAQRTASPSLSIFLPTYRVGPETQQNAIRFKNLRREAEKRLRSDGMGPREVEALLQPADTLLNDGVFWEHQYEGLAVFLSAEESHAYRLPFTVEELLVISDSYYVKPVLPLFTNNGHYYILALSQNAVRLFEGTRRTVGQIDLPEGTPDSLESALWFDDPERSLQFHTASSPGGNMETGVFHGQGGEEDERKVRIQRYLNRVDRGLEEIFREQRTPLVLAGVDYLLPIYHEVSDYAHIMAEGITGNPEELRAEELQARAWPIVEPYFRQEMEGVIEQYQQLAGTERATDQIEELVSAAFYGRVASLILAADAQVWGTFDPKTGKARRDPEGQGVHGDLGLLDFAATKTLANGGTVYALTQEEMPTDAPAVAVLRY